MTAMNALYQFTLSRLHNACWIVITQPNRKIEQTPHPTIIFQFQLIAVSWSFRRLSHCVRRCCQLISLVLNASPTHTTTTFNFLESILFAEIEIKSTCKYRKPLSIRASASAVIFSFSSSPLFCTTNYFYLIKHSKALPKLLAIVSPNLFSTCKTNKENYLKRTPNHWSLETRRQKWKEIDLVWNFENRNNLHDGALWMGWQCCAACIRWKIYCSST